MSKKETESERAKARALREKLPADLRAKIGELDQRLVTYLDEYDRDKAEGEEDNTAIRDLRAKVAEALKSQSIHPSQGTIGPAPLISTLPEGLPVTERTIPSPPPDMPTRPAVTKPSPAMLAESRTEPDSSRLEKDHRLLSPPPHSGGRILVIDDDAAIRATIADILAEQGYRVCPAENGKDGLKRLFQMPDCDLVLLDMMMPVMSGFDFLEIFDENPAWTMPVVVLSAHMKDRDFTRTEEGHEVFIGDKPREALKKPIYLDAFLATVQRMVQVGKQRRRQ